MDKTPFYSQLLAIRLGHAFMNDNSGLYQELSKKFNIDKNAILTNVFGIFGSAGTGKTTMIANVLSKMAKSGQNIMIGGINEQLKKLAAETGISDAKQQIDINKFVNEIAPGNSKQENVQFVEGNNIAVLAPSFKLQASSTYDSKLKQPNTVLIIDEATLINATA